MVICRVARNIPLSFVFVRIFGFKSMQLIKKLKEKYKKTQNTKESELLTS